MGHLGTGPTGTDIGAFGGGRPCPLELGPSKFQERPSGPSEMQENLLAAGALPEPHWGRLQRSPDPVASGEGAGCLLLSNPTPLSAIWTSGFGPWGLRIGGLADRNMMGWIHLWVVYRWSTTPCSAGNLPKFNNRAADCRSQWVRKAISGTSGHRSSTLTVPVNLQAVTSYLCSSLATLLV